MSEKVALVRLRARNDQYDQAMDRSADKTDKVSQAAQRISKADLDEFGSKMTRGVTVPITAAGAAGFLLAKNYNQTFTQMTTLAGVTSGEISGLKDSVDGLAGETARSPQELAEALYYVRSAGLDGTDALEATEASAKGAAIGLGEAATVADVASSALNTYGSENLSATHAVDMLAAAVAAGKGEASDMAPVLGALLPVGKNLGLGFDQLAGSVAFLTRNNGDAARSATQVGSVLNVLLKPGQQAQEVLEGVGLSAEKVRQYVAEHGLIDALTMLNDKLGGNRDQIGRLIEDREAVQGFFALINNGGTDAAEVIDSVTNSAGYLEDAFAKVRETDEFKLDQQLVDLQRVGVEVGQQLIPIFTDVGDVIAGVASGFAALPDGLQKGLILLAAMAAATGPVINGLNGLDTLLTKVGNTDGLAGLITRVKGLGTTSEASQSTLSSLIAVAARSPVAWAAAAGGIALLVTALIKARDRSDEARKAAQQLVDTANNMGSDPAEEFKRQLAVTLTSNASNIPKGGLDAAGRRAEVLAAADTVRMLKVDVVELADALLTQGDDAWNAYVAKLREAAAASLEQSKALGLSGASLDHERGIYENGIATLTRWHDQGAAVSRQQEVTAEQAEQVASTMALLGVEQDGAADSAAGLAGQHGPLAAGMGAVGDATDSTTGSIEDQIDKARELYDARAAVDAAADAVTAAERDLADSHRSASEAARQVTADEKAVGEALKQSAEADRGRAAAARATAEAERSAAKAREDHTDSIEEAQEAARSLAQAEREAAGDSDRLRDAQARAEDAEDALTAAHDRNRRAIESLSDARAAATERLDDMARSARGAELSEQSAQLSVDRARQRLAEVNADPKATALDRREAALALKQAELAYEEAVDRRTDLAAQLADANARGVEGSEEVVAANEEIAASNDAVAAAEAAQLAARKNITTVQEELDARVVEARKAVEDANRRVEDSAYAVQQADQRVADSRQGQIDAEDRYRDAVAGVGEARDRVAASRQRWIDANSEIEASERKVEQANVDHAFAIADLFTTMGDPEGAAEFLRDELRKQAEQMDPNSPLRRNILALADDLDKRIAGDREVNIRVNVFKDSSFDALVSLGAANPGQVNAERNNRAGTGTKTRATGSDFVHTAEVVPVRIVDDAVQRQYDEALQAIWAVTERHRLEGPASLARWLDALGRFFARGAHGPADNKPPRRRGTPRSADIADALRDAAANHTIGDGAAPVTITDPMPPIHDDGSHGPLTGPKPPRGRGQYDWTGQIQGDNWHFGPEITKLAPTTPTVTLSPETVRQLAASVAPSVTVAPRVDASDLNVAQATTLVTAITDDALYAAGVR